MTIEIGAVLGGRYRLERQLAAGGMGSVWLASSMAGGAQVAIKVLDLEAAAETPDARSRFEREARAVSRLLHPNIVRVVDFGFDEVTPFFVMEHLSGESLEDRLRKRKRLPLPELAGLLRQIEGGLSTAHEARIIHRDLKPGNLFLARTPAGEEVVKILDFGIAKQTDVQIDHSTKTGEFMGSPHYMSPEQIRDSKGIDTRSDLWSLGIVLYRAITGTLPFPGTTLGAVLADVLSGTIPKPSEIVADLPPSIDAFFERALARDRNQRFSSAREMADAFAAIAAPEPPAEPAPDSQDRPTMDSPMATATPFPAAPLGQPLETVERAPDSKTQLWASNSGVMQTPAPREQGSWAPGPESNPAIPVQPVNPYMHSANTSGLTARPSQPAWPTQEGAYPQRPPTPPPSQPGPPPDWSGSSRRMQSPVLQAPPAAPVSEGLSWAAKGAISIGLSVMAALLLVVLLRGGGQESGTSGANTVPSYINSIEIQPNPPPTAPENSAASTGVPEESGSGGVEGVIEMQEGSGVEEALEANPELMEGADAGVVAKYKIPPIPPGKGRLIITSKVGPCKVTVNGQSAGSTPVHVFVAPGKVKVYCRLQTGSTKSMETTVPKSRTTFLTFKK